MNSDYMATIRMLKTLDPKQLLELFHDLEDPSIVAQIADSAYAYVDSLPSTTEVLHSFIGMTDDEDALSLDNAQRARDIKSTQDSLK